jgi:hypothetical protein
MSSFGALSPSFAPGLLDRPVKPGDDKIEIALEKDYSGADAHSAHQ